MANNTPTPAPLPQTLWVDWLRHGEPEGERCFRGRQDDVLTSNGWQQMERAVASCSRPERIISSPLTRCRAFAENLATRYQCPITIAPDWREIDFGDWEGLPIDRIDSTALSHYWADPLNHTPPNGEPLHHFQQRVLAAWAHFLATAQEQRVMIIAHGGTQRIVLAHILGIPLDRCHQGLAIPHACHSQLRIDRTPEGLFSALIAHRPPNEPY